MEALGDDDLIGAALGVAADLGAVLLAVEVDGERLLFQVPYVAET